MINKVILIGNLTRDAETVAGAQTTMTRMRLATHSSWRDPAGEWQQRSEYHVLVAFGDLAERCSLSCTRGRRVYVEGRLRTREYLGAEGMRRWSTEIVADVVRTLDRERDDAALDDTAGTPGDVVEPGTGSDSVMITATRTQRRRSRPPVDGAARGDVGRVSQSSLDTDAFSQSREAAPVLT